MNTSPPDPSRILTAPLSHFPDRSARWLLSDPENVKGLVSLVAEHIVDHLDFSRLSAVNRDFISDTLREQEADLVFSVPFREGTAAAASEVKIHILIEHQSSVDRAMWFRFFSYMYNLWGSERQEWASEGVSGSARRLSPIVPILFYTGDASWQLPLSATDMMEVPELLLPFIPSFEVLCLDVKRCVPEALTREGHPFGWLLRVLREEGSSESVLREALRSALSGLEVLGSDRLEQHNRGLIYLASLVYHRRPVVEREGLIALIDSHSRGVEVETMFKSMAETHFEEGEARGIAKGEAAGEARGIAKGRAEGRAEGEAKGRAEGEAKGRAEVYQEIQAWDERRRAAEARGEVFTEPLPSPSAAPSDDRA